MQCKFLGKVFIFVCVWVLPVSFNAIKVEGPVHSYRIVLETELYSLFWKQNKRPQGCTQASKVREKQQERWPKIEHKFSHVCSK